MYVWVLFTTNIRLPWQHKVAPTRQPSCKQVFNVPYSITRARRLPFASGSAPCLSKIKVRSSHQDFDQRSSIGPSHGTVFVSAQCSDWFTKKKYHCAEQPSLMNWFTVKWTLLLLDLCLGNVKTKVFHCFRSEANCFSAWGLRNKSPYTKWVTDIPGLLVATHRNPLSEIAGPHGELAQHRDRTSLQRIAVFLSVLSGNRFLNTAPLSNEPTLISLNAFYVHLLYTYCEYLINNVY